MLLTCTPGLGLELWKDDRLRWKSGSPDPEAGTSGASPTVVSRPGRVPRVVPGPGGSASSTAAKVLGVIPLRVWLIVIYLSVLHIAVMVGLWGRACTEGAATVHQNRSLVTACRFRSLAAMMLLAFVQHGRRQEEAQLMQLLMCCITA